MKFRQLHHQPDSSSDDDYSGNDDDADDDDDGDDNDVRNSLSGELSDGSLSIHSDAESDSFEKILDKFGNTIGRKLKISEGADQMEQMAGIAERNHDKR